MSLTIANIAALWISTGIFWSVMDNVWDANLVEIDVVGCILATIFYIIFWPVMLLEEIMKLFLKLFGV